MSPARTLVSGPQAISAAEALRRQEKVDRAWPYIWDYAPPGSKMDQSTAWIAVPAVATPTEVVNYQVADGMDFYPTGLVLVLLGTTMNPGDFTWTLTVNSPAGVTAAQALPYDGFVNVPFSLGTLEIPWPIPRAERNVLHSRDTLRIVVNNVNVGIGAGSFAGVIMGYLFDPLYSRGK